MHPVEMAVETVLAGILFATLRTYDIGILVSEVGIFNVPFQRHLVEVLVAVGALFPTVPLLLPRSIR